MAEPVQPSVGDHLGNAGSPPTVPFGERVLTVAYCTPKIIAAMENQIAQMAMIEAEILGGGCPDRIGRMIATRQHRALGPLWKETFSGHVGDCLLLWACITVNHPDFTWADVLKLVRESGAQVRAALEIIRPDFYRGLAEVTPYRLEEIRAMYGEANPTPA